MTLGGYFSVTLCYHNGINRVKTVTSIFTFHVGLQMNVQFFDESRGDFCRMLASRVRRHTRTHTTILRKAFEILISSLITSAYLYTATLNTVFN